MLVTIIEDLSSEPVLKVWALDQIDKKTGDPRCASSLTVTNGKKYFPVGVSGRVVGEGANGMGVTDDGFCGDPFARAVCGRLREWDDYADPRGPGTRPWIEAEDYL